ncbi:MAG: hypothetical protein GYA36_03605 [Veillonellaceae bacterium]|nr:hypothetical protein [Veillonellaceae bacterium]
MEKRDPELCPVCGQPHIPLNCEVLREDVAEKDLDARVNELTEIITMHEANLHKHEKNLSEICAEKTLIDEELNRQSFEYDSAYLSAVLETEKARSALKQKLFDIRNIEILIQRITNLSTKATTLIAEEQKVRSALKEARTIAEKDTRNLNRLKELFLDCLLRAQIPGILVDDTVEMKSPNFLPEVTSVDAGDLAVTSFANLGSGGKKTLFKCCFAVALHRLAVETGAMLPTIMIIDSPMKNISERENRKQFEGFFKMLYQLCENELKGTQFILIDKEYCKPPEDFQPSFSARYMTPDDDHNPPLIRYYRGK